MASIATIIPAPYRTLLVKAGHQAIKDGHHNTQYLDALRQKAREHHPELFVSYSDEILRAGTDAEQRQLMEGS